jgi:Holliday junction resolvasome RuvABC ATP-dependent DNA helicase subunit
VDSARIRRGRLPHTLLVSKDSGMGRRAAIRLVARQLGKRLVELCAPFTIDQLAQAVDHLRYADILFIEDLDRAHGLGAAGPGTLTTLVESREVLLAEGSRHLVDEISIVASTAKPDDVPSSLLDRFPVQMAMAGYSLSELAQLAVDFAFKHRSEELLSDDMAVHIAVLAEGAGPAEVERLVLLAKDLTVTLGRPPEAEEIARYTRRLPM